MTRRDFLSSILVVVKNVFMFVFVFTSHILQGCRRFPHNRLWPAQKRKPSPDIEMDEEVETTDSVLGLSGRVVPVMASC